MNLIEEFEKVQSTEELIQFWNQYMRYGWKTQSGKLYRGMKCFNKNEYVISSIEECIESRYYTCVEMTHIFASQFQKQGEKIQKFCLVLPEKRNIHCFATMKENDAYYTYQHNYAGFKLYGGTDLEKLIYQYQISEFMYSHQLKARDEIEVYQYEELKPGMNYPELIKTIQTKGFRIK